MRGRKNGPEQGEGGGELAGPREETERDSAQERECFPKYVKGFGIYPVRY
jgi:hypothetical protein